MQPVFENNYFFSHEDDLSESLFNSGLCLPSGSGMSKYDVQRVVTILKETFKAVIK